MRDRGKAYQADPYARRADGSEPETRGPTCGDHELAAWIRRVCLEAALAGHEQARMSGLCLQGAWDVALDRIRSLDLESAIQAFEEDQNSRR